MKASALEKYSSRHELSMSRVLGLKTNTPFKRFYVEFNFNLHTPLKLNPETYLTFHFTDACLPPSAPNCCFRINNLQRWRLDISSYQTIDDYLKTCARWHRSNYTRSKKRFLNYGCEMTFIEGDWSNYAETAYHLYANVAHRYGRKLYDLHFFQEISKHPDCLLQCAWFQGEMIGMFVLLEELPTLHSVCCGFDYKHSSASYAYSWMHFALFEKAINLQKYQNIDVGLSADGAKKEIGLNPVLSRLDIYCNGRVTRKLLKLVSRFFIASINSKEKLKLAWRYSLSRKSA